MCVVTCSIILKAPLVIRSFACILQFVTCCGVFCVICLLSLSLSLFLCLLLLLHFFGYSIYYVSTTVVHKMKTIKFKSITSCFYCSLRFFCGYCCCVIHCVTTKNRNRLQCKNLPRTFVDLAWTDWNVKVYLMPLRWFVFSFFSSRLLNFNTDLSITIWILTTDGSESSQRWSTRWRHME